MTQNETFFRSIGRAKDPAADIFFSPGNVSALQTQLRYEVYLCTGAVIDEQSPQALRGVMEAVYEEHARTYSGCGPRGSGQTPGMFSGPGVAPGVFPSAGCSAPPSASVAQLNTNVLRKVVADVVNAVRSHRYYLDDISNPNPVPLNMPEYVGPSGLNQLNLFRE